MQPGLFVVQRLCLLVLKATVASWPDPIHLSPSFKPKHLHWALLTCSLSLHPHTTPPLLPCPLPCAPSPNSPFWCCVLPGPACRPSPARAAPVRMPRPPATKPLLRLCRPLLLLDPIPASRTPPSCPPTCRCLSVLLACTACGNPSMVPTPPPCLNPTPLVATISVSQPCPALVQPAFPPPQCPVPRSNPRPHPPKRPPSALALACPVHWAGSHTTHPPL